MPINWNQFSGGLVGGAQQGLGLVNQMRMAPIQQKMAEDELRRKEQMEQFNAPRQISISGQNFNVPEAKAAELMQQEAIRKMMLDAKRAQAGVVPGMTPGRKAADQAYGKDYVEWKQVGAPEAMQNLAGLEDAKNKYASDKDMGGPIAGAVPDMLLGFTGQTKLKEVKQQLASTIQGTLRATLGAQFTENEGKRIIANAFDPTVSHAENARRIDALHKKLTAAANAKQAMADYFEENGTLTGYKGLDPRAAFESSGNDIMGPKQGEIVDGYRFMGGDPSNQQNWKAVR